jgi:hypothetical protein
MVERFREFLTALRKVYPAAKYVIEFNGDAVASRSGTALPPQHDARRGHHKKS